MVYLTNDDGVTIDKEFFFFLLYHSLLLFLFAVMHDLCFIHTDLKPENILLISSEYIKVPDYKVIPFGYHNFPFWLHTYYVPCILTNFYKLLMPCILYSYVLM